MRRKAVICAPLRSQNSDGTESRDFLKVEQPAKTVKPKMARFRLRFSQYHQPKVAFCNLLCKFRANPCGQTRFALRSAPQAVKDDISRTGRKTAALVHILV